MAIDWDSLYSERARQNPSSALGKLLGFGSVPGIISLAGGFPAAELFPVDAFQCAMDTVMSSDAKGALQYGPSEGYLPLKEFLADRMTRRLGVPVSTEDVLITSGSQQGLDLLARLFVDPGSSVVVEDPSYVGALEAFNGFQARYVAIPTDDDGMQVDLLEELLPGLSPRPRFIYALPNFQNPGGSTLSLVRRERLLELSCRYAIPILEDDPYGELRYEGDHLPSLKSMDADGNVIYLGTFSKILAPGLRLGWVVAHREVMHELVKAKQAADLHTDSLAQRLAHQVCKTGFLEEHIERLVPVYRERRDAILDALSAHLPEGSTFTRPLGGLFVWARLPEPVDTARMLADAVRERVAYVPGVAFHPHADRNNTLRLNFSNASPDLLREGVRRLCRVANQWCTLAEDAESELPPDIAAEAA